MLTALETFLGVDNATPDWQRALVLYGCLNALAAGTALLAHFVLIELQLRSRRVLGGLAQHTSDAMTWRLAQVTVRVEALMRSARGMTGVLVVPASVEPLPRELFARTSRPGRRVLASIVTLTTGLVAGVLRFALRLTPVNLVIWLVIAWHLGWLDPVADRIAAFRWRELEASQVAAALGLAIIAWTAVSRSDVRGRIEFSKAASLECRKRLHEIQPHLEALMRAEREAREMILRGLRDFPTGAELERLTGRSGLAVHRGRLVHIAPDADDPTEGFGRLADASVDLDLVDDSRLGTDGEQSCRDADSSTTHHFETVHAVISALSDLGYYPKLVSIVSPPARRAIFSLWSSGGWRYGLRSDALHYVSTIRGADRPRWRLKPLWDRARSESEIEHAARATEREIARVADRVHARLWDGYCASAEIDALLGSIADRHRDRLVDRLKA